MKKTLLSAPSIAILYQKPFSFKLFLLALTLWMASYQVASAQCGPYQVFEGVKDDFGNMTGWSSSGGFDTFTETSGAGYNRSGWYSIVNFGGTGEYLYAPTIATPLTFAFYASDPGANGGVYDIEVTDGAHPWQSLSVGANQFNYGVSAVSFPSLPGLGAWDQVSVTFGGSAQPGYSNSNLQIRIVDNSGGMTIDDISWTSRTASENTIVIPVLGGPTYCTQNMTAGQQYTFYDNGGVSDNYSGLQENSLTFTATAGDKIEITFNSFNTDFSTELSVHDGISNGAATLLSHSGPGNPGTVTYISTGTSMTLYFVSDDPNFSTAGFDITVKCVSGSTCFLPGTLSTGAVTSTSASVSWLAAAGPPPGYDIFYSTNNAATPGTPNFTNVTSPYNITGLAGGTTYYYWVRSNCGATQSAWVGPSTAFTTICNAVSVTYVENFNGQPTNALPTCTSSDNSNWQVNTTNGNLFCPVGNTNFFTKPISLVGGTEYRLTYDFSALLGSANFNVYYGTTNTTPTSANITTLLFSHIGASAIASNIINFTPGASGTYYIRFQLASTSASPNTQFNLDNIRLEIETCKPPTAVTASGVTASAATLNWTAPAIAPSSGYQYYINTINSTPSYSVTVSGSTPAGVTTTSLSGLTASTTFYVWVRSSCGGSFSAWSLVTSFTTNAGAAPVLISQGGTVTNCDYSFFDSGGAAASYVDFENHTITFAPGVAGTKIKVAFSSFSTENNWDGLMIYNGPTTASPIISSGLGAGFNATTCPAGSWRGTGSPGTVISTAANGELTFKFQSDFIITGSGWAAFVSCVISPTITSFTPANNSCGTAGVTVTITGTNFIGATSVKFNNTPATFTVVNSTTITATVPAAATSGIISVSNATATGYSASSFIVQGAPPTSTGVSICPGGAGTISSATVCNGFINSGTSMSGSLNAATDPTAPRPSPPGGNSTTCSFTASPRNYTSVQFQVSTTGTYIFGGASPYDMMGYITSGAFTPGSCATGTFIIGDDDSNGGLQPRLTVTLTAGVTYTLYTTTWGGTGTVSGAFTWTITPPVGGEIMLQGTPAIQWYTAASGGTLIGSGSPFNPVGVAGSGLADTNTPGTWTYYAACSSNSTCRTAAAFVIGGAVGGTASSTQTVCSNSASDLTLTGNTGSVVKWQYATDALFTIGVTDIAASAATTLTSAQIGTFTGTRYYRAVVNVAGCADVNSTVVSITFSKTIWNGTSWSSGAPSATVGAEFQGNFTSSVNAGPSGDLSACGVVVTSGNVLFDIGTLTVQNAVNVNSGSLTFNDDASLYQVVDVANAVGVYSGGNSGNITSKRDSSPMFLYDYTYWSAPVNPQTLLAVSPNSSTSLAYEYDAATSSWVYFNPNNVMQVGKGYILRAPLDFNLSPGTPLVHTASFYGVPNSGNLSIPIVGGATQMNLLGNPYPGSLSATKFINGNPNLNGTLYFWTHNTQSTAPYQYNQNDYALFNLVGGTAAAGTVGAGNSSVPTGHIASGQGFFVKGLTSGNAVYTNFMRDAGFNTQFYRNDSPSNDTDNSLEKHRYWLDITADGGLFKQALVGYIQTATNDIDRLFDGEMVDAGNTICLYTKAESVNLSIQGRVLPFDVNDTVPLGYKSTIASEYTISLSAFDGLFEAQNIYLEDVLLNVIHDLKVTPYTFATQIGTFDDRFILRYTTESLGTTDPIFNENSTVVYINGNNLHINSGTVNMKNVTIYDVRGREIASQKQIGDTNTVFTTLPTTQQVLLVKIEGENGGTVTKKVVY